jgi:glycerophosphoryl diester phosphodiesterase
MAPMPVQVIAHRGAGSGFADPESPPENTLPAFEAGWASGAIGCELDVQLTADREVIAIHDHTTGRTTNEAWVVGERTAEELQSLDAGSWKHPRWAGTRLPLLREVLAILPAGRRLFIELKDGPQIVGPAADAIRESGKRPSQLVLISFDIDTIIAAKAALPDFECQLVITCRTDDEAGGWALHFTEGPDFRPVRLHYDPTELVRMIRSHGIDGIDTSFVMPNSLIETMIAAGLSLVTWTVNDPKVALNLVRRGLTSITTDRPGEMRAALLAAGLTLA